LVEQKAGRKLAAPAAFALSAARPNIRRRQSQVVLAVDVSDNAVVVEMNQIALAQKRITLPKSRRKRWAVAPSGLGLYLVVQNVSTRHDLLAVEATQSEWLQTTSLEQLQKLSVDLAGEAQLFIVRYVS
jgi:hypothetical protein